MSRETKFRIKLIEKIGSKREFIRHYTIEQLITGSMWDKERYDHEILGEFTGFKDMNGVDVYEGDQLHIPGYYCEVVFQDGGFFTVYNHPEDGEVLPISEVSTEKMDIIGNIHFNSELLNR